MPYQRLTVTPLTVGIRAPNNCGLQRCAEFAREQIDGNEQPRDGETCRSGGHPGLRCTPHPTEGLPEPIDMIWMHGTKSLHANVLSVLAPELDCEPAGSADNAHVLLECRPGCLSGHCSL